MIINASDVCCYFCSEMISPIKDLYSSSIPSGSGSGSKTNEQPIQCPKKRINRFSVENQQSVATRRKMNSEEMKKTQSSTAKLSRLGDPVRADELSQLNQRIESNGSSQSNEPLQNIFGATAK